MASTGPAPASATELPRGAPAVAPLPEWRGACAPPCTLNVRRVHRLYWRIWLAVLASLALFTLGAGLTWKLLGDRGDNAQQRVIAELSAAVLPPPEAQITAVSDALAYWKARLGADLVLHAASGARVAGTTDDIVLSLVEQRDSGWVMTPRGPVHVIRLPDGRTLAVRRIASGGWRPPLGWLGWLGVIAVAVGVGAYPAVRRLTRRLEALQASVERWGEGDLRTRVAVRGNDEIARLAQSFNYAAARIEQLVAAQRSLLANASHELRSPLARVRLAIEMLPTSGKPDLERELRQNIAELDQLIDEILLASRLDAQAADGSARNPEALDLTALIAEECARAQVTFDVTVTENTAVLRGEPRLLRRLIRNLIENALRHGGGAEVSVELAGTDDGLRLRVCDRGPGIAEAERERIFEPFYRAAGASEAAGGAGLGLALVRSIARRHGGEARCEAREGGGSCFVVTLPA